MQVSSGQQCKSSDEGTEPLFKLFDGRESAAADRPEPDNGYPGDQQQPGFNISLRAKPEQPTPSDPGGDD